MRGLNNSLGLTKANSIKNGINSQNYLPKSIKLNTKLTSSQSSRGFDKLGFNETNNQYGLASERKIHVPSIGNYKKNSLL